MVYGAETREDLNNCYLRGFRIHRLRLHHEFDQQSCKNAQQSDVSLLIAKCNLAQRKGAPKKLVMLEQNKEVSTKWRHHDWLINRLVDEVDFVSNMYNEAWEMGMKKIYQSLSTSHVPTLSEVRLSLAFCQFLQYSKNICSWNCNLYTEVWFASQSHCIWCCNQAIGVMSAFLYYDETQQKVISVVYFHSISARTITILQALGHVLVESVYLQCYSNTIPSTCRSQWIQQILSCVVFSFFLCST